ncbi:uncharacterized protein A4U43_C10F3730 [Asparagus officinalis]|uniref:Inhibitor I9 domain-containing protein n=1 Tax=Asparagus officinalis TaxID=4686 RepID=A0A5P1E0E3_ASPOF|nr:uncharacterized protein A4U43_C10F3730 [Asparagus officinalis]
MGATQQILKPTSSMNKCPNTPNSSPSETEEICTSFLPNATSNSSEPIVYAYQHAISGFVANLMPEELQVIKTRPGVLSVYPEHECELQTTYSQKFLGLSRSNGLWLDLGYGRGIIIGMINSRIKLDHPSFDDKNMPPPPQPPIWNGKCYFIPGGCKQQDHWRYRFQ